VVRRYWGAWGAIVAQAGKNGKLNHEHMWFVDAFAGAGLHASDEHPYGALPGSALSACYQARNIQRKYPECRVHVRLIDINKDYCTSLEERTKRFTSATSHPDKVDVQVMRGRFVDYSQTILDETRHRGKQFLSLWFIDPDGVKEIPHASIEPLCLKFGTEIVINLAVHGLFRIARVLDSKVAPKSLQDLDEGLLNATFGGGVWRAAITGKFGRTLLDALAVAYAESFPAFDKRHAFPLNASGTQFRYLIHLAQPQRAETAFTQAYNASQRVGFLSGNALTTTERDSIAKRLFDKFRGTSMTKDELFDAQDHALNRVQLNSVLTAAETLGLGRLRGELFEWLSEPEQPLKFDIF